LNHSPKPIAKHFSDIAYFSRSPVVAYVYENIAPHWSNIGVPHPLFDSTVFADFISLFIQFKFGKASLQYLFLMVSYR
jgi:hypothetical protein